MNKLRWFLGFTVVTFGLALSRVSHRCNHIGAWLMDREDAIVDCPNCEDEYV